MVRQLSFVGRPVKLAFRAANPEENFLQDPGDYYRVVVPPDIMGGSSELGLALVYDVDRETC